MAARINPVIAQHHRDKIKTTQLILRLQNHVLRKTKLSPTQIQAINILLKKSIPDLKSIEMTGQVDLDVAVTKVIEEIIE